MQYSFVTLAALIAAVTAQNGASGVPACAASCVTLLPSGCQAQDIGCICGNNEFITNVSCCVSQKCTGSDQAAALQFAQQICQAGGVTLTVTGATCIGSSSTSAPATRSSSAGAGGVATTSSGSAASTPANTSAGTAAATTTSSRISTGGAAQATAMAGYLGAAIAAAALL